MSKIYRLNENQLRVIRENVMRESPEEFSKGDHIMLQEFIDGFDVPANSEGIVLHVDAAGTVRTQFIVNGKPIVVPINPDIDKIIKFDPAWKESMAKIKPDPLWGDVKKLGEGEQFSIPPAAFAPKDPSIMEQLINAAVRDGYLDGAKSRAGKDAMFVMDAAKEIGAQFEKLPHEERKVMAKVYYKKFLKLIGYNIGEKIQPLTEYNVNATDGYNLETAQLQYGNLVPWVLDKYDLDKIKLARNYYFTERENLYKELYKKYNRTDPQVQIALSNLYDKHLENVKQTLWHRAQMETKSQQAYNGR
jgi:hypothetical protein